MMNKILEITSCDGCPYLNRENMVCTKNPMNHKTVLQKYRYRGFPEWCPLPTSELIK